ncbi:MAG: ABC transporter permease [Gammaproteobacteria bacterium]|nr:ABC transporter permease [Gammaproteobacteria bacterium]
MSWTAALQLAMRALWRNRTRAMLTTLGVIIGVAAVITMVAIGTGAQKRIADQLESMGSHNLSVRPGAVTRGGVRTGSGTITTMTIADAKAVSQLPGVIAVVPSVRDGVQARYRGTNWGTSIEGVTPDFLSVGSWSLAAGKFLTDGDIVSAAHVCVLGQTVVKELFGLENPIDESILIKGLACRVIGVLEAKGASAWGSDMDDTIVAPITTIQQKILGINYIHRIEIQTEDRLAAFRVQTELTPLLRQMHRLGEKQNDDFRVFNRAELAQTSEESARVFSWLLASIASVSLLVGGIGIMNIMLVSVTERTREIGIRMALGAKRRDILWQFLLEAIVLSAAGGVLGIFLGIGGAVLLSSFSDFVISITPWSIVLAFSFALIVGVFFGLHPARKASRLRPIQALRYE